MKHEQFLKFPSIFIEKCRWRKGRLLKAPTCPNRFWFCQRCLVVQYALLLNGKVTTNSIKHQESIVDETWAILKTSINFHRKMPMKKGSLVKSSYMSKPILILSTMFSSAVCPLFKMQKLRRIRSSIKSPYSMKHEQFLKFLSTFIEKCR